MMVQSDIGTKGNQTMAKQQPENTRPFQSFTKNLGLALFLVRAWATSLEVFLHRDFGERYLGWQAVVVWLLVPCYASTWRGYDVRPLLLFLPAYLLMCVISRMKMLARRHGGEMCHSFYTGWPRILKPTVKGKELTVKRIYEPVFMFFLGFAIRDRINAPLGTYFMIGAVCLFISVSASEMASRVRSLDLNDTAIDQEIIAERFREMRGEGW